jgi:hypothetical protein
VVYYYFYASFTYSTEILPPFLNIVVGQYMFKIVR